MAFIAFLGCDGSGKSTVIQGVSDYLTASGVSVKQGHWRPRMLDIRAEIISSAADDPHRLNNRGFSSSLVKLGWLWLNWWLSWIFQLAAASRNGVVLFDRYHADLLVDPKRYRYGGPLVVARIASRCMPQPDLVVFLDAPSTVLLSRKQEVTEEALNKSREAYTQLAKHQSRFVIIDAQEPASEVIDAVIASITQIRTP